MARASTVFVCQGCGHKHAKWAGKCDQCQTWGSFVEETVAQTSPFRAKSVGSIVPYVDLQHQQPNLTRWESGIREFDRVCGGGLVPGSAVLIGGDPGIGKSTILLQALAALAAKYSVVYISGEESIDQIQRRAYRLGVGNASVSLASETNLDNILATLEQDKRVNIVVIDSIQTLYAPELESSIGTVTQVRACAQRLIHWVKKSNAVLLLVGHVTKEGSLAGPKVLEHMVDTVLYFEGEKSHLYRILRASKNRYGPCNEIGIFDMTDQGLYEVKNPSGFFMGAKETADDGSAVFAGMEGSRPFLVEIQALATPCPYGTPRRMAVGLDVSRLHMILAVLEARCKLSFFNKDIYINVVGGLRITDPGADLAIAASLLSTVSGKPLPHRSVFLGEISLSGEVRPVQALNLRIKEAQQLGFHEIYMPDSPLASSHKALNHVRDIFSFVT